MADELRMHQRMARGDMKAGVEDEDFGVEKLSEQSAGNNRDLDRTTHRKTMRDHERGASRPVERGEGMHPAQSAPDHGPHGVDY